LPASRTRAPATGRKPRLTRNLKAVALPTGALRGRTDRRSRGLLALLPVRLLGPEREVSPKATTAPEPDLLVPVAA
jgi:hypothetical protein